MLLESEKNCVAVSTTLAYDDCFKSIYEQIKAICPNVQILYNTKDYWCRDYMPIQVSKTDFLKFDYKPDYLVRSDNKDEKNSRTSSSNIQKAYDSQELPKCRETDLIIDGGNVVVAENFTGERKVIMTEKVFYENRHGSKDNAEEVTKKLKEYFDCEIVFLPWDIFDSCGHTDGIVNTIAKGKLLVNFKLYEPYIANEMRRRLLKARFELIELELSEYHDLSWAYINMLKTKDFVIIPAVEEKTDKEAFDFIKALLPQYENRVYQINTRNITKEYGGALNCMTWTYLK